MGELCWPITTPYASKVKSHLDYAIWSYNSSWCVPLTLVTSGLWALEAMQLWTGFVLLV